MALTRTTKRAAAAREQGEAALLDAAEALVCEGTPYGDVSVAAIAARAGFSRATFYAYFSDKRALALALGERLGAALEARSGSWLREGEGDVRPTLEAVAAVFAEHEGTVRVLSEASTYDEAVAAQWRALHERFEALAADRVRSGAPGLDDAALAARAYVLVWATERCLTEHVSQGARVDREALLDALVDVWHALS
jgi:AcrR family transcriptional regulator